MSDHKQSLMQMHAEMNQVLGITGASNIYLGEHRIVQFRADQFRPMVEEWLKTIQALTLREMER